MRSSANRWNKATSSRRSTEFCTRIDTCKQNGPHCTIGNVPNPEAIARLGWGPIAGWCAACLADAYYFPCVEALSPPYCKSSVNVRSRPAAELPKPGIARPVVVSLKYGLALSELSDEVRRARFCTGNACIARRFRKGRIHLHERGGLAPMRRMSRRYRGSATCMSRFQ